MLLQLTLTLWRIGAYTRPLLAAFVLALAGCSDEPADGQPEASSEQAESAMAELRSLGDNYRKSNPWISDKTPWAAWARYESFDSFDTLGNRLDRPRLTIRIYLRLPDATPLRRVEGDLEIRDDQGAVCYSGPFVIDRPGDSFASLVFEDLVIDYDDGNPMHRQLRHTPSRSATFRPSKSVRADGSVLTY